MKLTTRQIQALAVSAACLIGGAAHADFVFGTNPGDIFGYVQILDGGEEELYYDSVFNPALVPYVTNTTIDSEYIAGEFGFSITNTLIEIHAQSTGPTFGGFGITPGTHASALSFDSFTVDTDTQVLLEWALEDYSGLIGADGAFGGIVIGDAANNNNILFNTADFDGGFGHTTGSFLLTLEAGQNYAMNMLVGSLANSDMFVSISVVPGPSAFALLSVGGLMASRRRR